MNRGKRLAVGASLLACCVGIGAEPPMTRFVAEQLSTSHWYDISAAKRDFGYTPRVGIEEGLKKLRSSYTESFRSLPTKA